LDVFQGVGGSDLGKGVRKVLMCLIGFTCLDLNVYTLEVPILTHCPFPCPLAK